MKSSEYGRITDELLSAYIDNAVTEQERNLVEAAAAVDAEIAWRLDTLQQTVQMLRALPELALPRSFALQESQIRNLASAGAGQTAGPAPSSVWGRIAGGWRAFWRPGSPVYRNLAAASLVLLLVLVGGNTLMDSSMNGMSAPAAEIAFSEPAAADANGDMAATAELRTDAQAAKAGAPPPAEDAVGAAEAPEMRAQEMPAEEAELAVGAAASEPPPEAAAAAMPAVAEGEEAVTEESAASAAPEAAEALALEAPAAPVAMAVERSAPAAAGEAAEPSLASAAAEPAADAGVITEAAQAAEPDFSAAAAEPAPAEGAASEAEAALPEEAAGEEEAMPAAAEEPVEPGAELAVTDEDDGSEAVAALPLATATPLPTATAQALTAAESPQTTPYPEPEPQPRFDAGALAPSRILTLALFAAAIVFGGLWWRSRSASKAGSGVE